MKQIYFETGLTGFLPKSFKEDKFHKMMVVLQTLI